jgi:nucleotide-binding universal stress UspA family protein
MQTVYDTIVIPLDGSPLAEQVFGHLKRISSPAQTELHLVGVLEAWRYAIGTPDLAMADLITYMRSDQQQYLAKQSQCLQQQGYRVQVHQREGDAALTIVAIAEQVGAQLIAMTTHGRSGMRRWTLGSVAERVIHATDLPVLLARDETITNGALKRILVPLDGSPIAEQALSTVIDLAAMTGATVVLLHVIQALDPTNQRMLFQSKTEAESAVEQWTADGEFYLEGIGQRLLQQGIDYDVRVRTGDPDRVICATTVDAAIDMVIMGTHGRTGVGRWVYGSVANKVLRGISCPLLLVRSHEEDMENT